MTKNELEERVADLETDLERTQQVEKLLSDSGLSVWWASNETVPHLAASLDTGISFAIYSEGGTARGLVVYDESELVGAFGEVPAALMLDEIAYVREN